MVLMGSGCATQGDFYVIPAGVAHEFLNRQKALSIAWNLVPVCTQTICDALPWILLQRSMKDAAMDLSSIDRLVRSGPVKNIIVEACVCVCVCVGVCVFPDNRSC